MSKKSKAKAESRPSDGNGHNSGPTPEEQRMLFLNHRTAFRAAKNKLSLAQDNLKKVKAVIKADGFTVKQIEVAIALDDPKGEATVRREINQTMQAALWVGCDIGAQLDLFKGQVFNEDTDRAFDEGEQASMENRPAKPDYAPDTPQYRAFMNGYYKHQESLIRDNIKTPEQAAAEILG